MDHYIARYEPFDKAGGYGVQDLIGFCRRNVTERILLHRDGVANSPPFQSFKQFEIITLGSWL